MKKIDETVFAIHFFVNMSSTGELGHSLIMMITPFLKIGELLSMIEDKMYLTVSGNPKSSNFYIEVGKAEGVSLSYNKNDLETKNVYISSSPLREDIWGLDTLTQNELLEKIKFQEASKIIDSFEHLSLDTDRLEIILDKYTSEERNLDSKIFVQVSDIYHVGRYTYD